MDARASPIPSSPSAPWEPNPEWSLDGPRYLITLRLPENCASGDIAVAQFRRVNHDEIRISILNDSHYLWSMFFFHGDVDTSVQPTATFNGEEMTLTLGLQRLGYRSTQG